MEPYVRTRTRGRQIRAILKIETTTDERIGYDQCRSYNLAIESSTSYFFIRKHPAAFSLENLSFLSSFLPFLHEFFRHVYK